jgi:hypothetical protein
METAQLQTTSDIAELEHLAAEGVARAWKRPRFGWGISPTIERASAARERLTAAETVRPEEPAPVVPLHVFTAVEVVTYTELMTGIRQKLATLGIRYLDFDVLAGFAPGLTGKALGACQAKRLGPEKIFDALRAAGLRLRLEEDPEQTAKMTARIAQRFRPRDEKNVRINNRNHARPSEQLIHRVLCHLGRSHEGLVRLNEAIGKALAKQAGDKAKGIEPCS